MKYFKLSALVLSLILFSCEDNATDEITAPVIVNPPATITGVTIVAYNQKLLVSWNALTESNIDYYTVNVSPASPNPPIVISSSSRWITGLTNDVTYTITVTATNTSQKTSTPSTPVMATPKDGSADVTAVQTLVTSGMYDAAIAAIDAALTSTTQIPTDEVKSQLYAERGHAYTLKGNGLASDANYAQALADFKVSTTDDAYAGRAVIGMLLHDYDAAVEGANHLLSSGSYSNTATGWSYFDVMLNGGWGAWWNADYSTCATFLDEIDFVKNHDADGDELYDDLLRIAATL